uniref:Ionotropic glutamate receptor C-terminal domain-containing protein n=1 Tax=Anopheles christyi TaxID=43041 RepID=A0A182KFZ6_9DIPT
MTSNIANNKAKSAWQYEHKTFVDHVVKVMICYCCGMLMRFTSFDESIKIIYFYPKWMFETGYEVVYDLDNTLAIYRWNRYSNQTTAIDPHNIIVPDEMRDLHGYRIVMWNMEYISKVMTFDAYFLEQMADKRNAIAIQTDEYSYSDLDVMPLFGVQNMVYSLLIPSFGTTFTAVKVPRAKPKLIVSILIDPFDVHTWLTYLILVLTMAIIISLLGKRLGMCHFVEIVLELIMICLAGPSRVYGGSIENRIITMFCVMGIVLISSYQSLIISFMSFVRYGPEINTLAEIQEHCLFPDTKITSFFNFKTYPNGSWPGSDKACLLETGRDNELQTIMIDANTVKDKHAYATDHYIRHRTESYRHAKTNFFEYPLCWIVKMHLRELFLFYVQAICESGIYEYYYNNKTKPAWQYEHKTFVEQVVKVDDLLLLWYAY